MVGLIQKAVVRAVKEPARELLYFSSASRPQKILFDHLPKCGGTSLNAYLQAHYPRRKTFSTKGYNSMESVDKFKNLPEADRHGYDYVKGHMAHELLDWAHPESLKVTLFRDPVERIISHYYYARTTTTHYLHSRICTLGISLEHYISHDGMSVELRNWYTTHFSGMTVKEAENDPKEAVSRALNAVLNRYDLVGFLDDFSSFAEKLRAQANLRYPYQDQRLNVTADRPPRDSIESFTIRKIERVNFLDVRFYNTLRDALA